MAAHRNLTFGIELEFICVRPTTLFASDDVGPNQQAGAAIYNAFLNNRIPATGYEDLDEDINEDAVPYSRWRVESDELALSEREGRHLPPGHTAESIELSSRVFHFYDGSWRHELAAVLRILRALEARGCRFITNKSTGLHVHVGRGRQGIDLRTAKNVLELCTAGEKCLDELHSVSRIGHPRDFAYRSNYFPLSFFHLYADGADPEYPVSMFQRLANIEAIRTWEDLGNFFVVDPPEEDGIPTSGHNSTVNFDNLFPDEELDRHIETMTGTIEFRQHSGTLDLPEITAWTILVCELVEYCSNASMTRMVDLCMRCADPNFRLRHFLEYVNCPPEIRDHYLDNGGSIGVIPENAGRQIPLHREFDALLEQNDHEAERNTDHDEVQAVIREKLETGVYGLDPRTRITIPSLSAFAVDELKLAASKLRASGMDIHSEVGESAARAFVFRRLPYHFTIQRR